MEKVNTDSNVADQNLCQMGSMNIEVKHSLCYFQETNWPSHLRWTADRGEEMLYLSYTPFKYYITVIYSTQNGQHKKENIERKINWHGQ